MEQLTENLKAVEGYFTAMAISLRESDPRESFRMFKCSEACRKAAEELQRNIPQPMEMEGGGSTWWHVCPECHGEISWSDHYCKHCGQAVKSDG